MKLKKRWQSRALKPQMCSNCTTDNGLHCPSGMTIESNSFPRCGPEYKMVLKQYGKQKRGYSELGTTLRSKVKNPLAADATDRYLAFQDCIPKDWAGKVVCFWGTIYKRMETLPVMGSSQTNGVEYERYYVRCMYMSGGKWVSDVLPLDDDFGPTRVSCEFERPNWFMRLINKIR